MSRVSEMSTWSYQQVVLTRGSRNKEQLKQQCNYTLENLSVTSKQRLCAAYLTTAKCVSPYYTVQITSCGPADLQMTFTSPVKSRAVFTVSIYFAIPIFCCFNTPISCWVRRSFRLNRIDFDSAAFGFQTCTSLQSSLSLSSPKYLSNTRI